MDNHMADETRRNPGNVRCLGGCDKLFYSVDKATNRICPECTKRNNKERVPRVISSQISTDGGTVSLEPEG